MTSANSDLFFERFLFHYRFSREITSVIQIRQNQRRVHNGTQMPRLKIPRGEIVPRSLSLSSSPPPISLSLSLSHSSSPFVFERETRLCLERTGGYAKVAEVSRVYRFENGVKGSPLDANKVEHLTREGLAARLHEVCLRMYRLSEVRE